MQITVELMPDEEAALRKFAVDLAPLPIEDAASFALRDFLIAHGYLQIADLDEDTPTAREA